MRREKGEARDTEKEAGNTQKRTRRVGLWNSTDKSGRERTGVYYREKESGSLRRRSRGERGRKLIRCIE